MTAKQRDVTLTVAHSTSRSMTSSFCHVVSRHSLSSYGRQAFAVAGPTAGNSLSDDLRDLMLSIDSFRRLLKTWLFSEY